MSFTAGRAPLLPTLFLAALLASRPGSADAPGNLPSVDEDQPKTSVIEPERPPVVEAPTRPEGAPLLVFRGNLLFNSFVYLALLELPASAKATQFTARRVRTKITSFLLRAGYSLAKVRTELRGGQILVDIDEGQLDKVLVLGVGAFDSVRFRFDLALPEDIYNKPLIDERVAQLCKRYRMARCAPTLVELDPVTSPEPSLGLEALEMLEDLGGASALLPAQLVRPARSYEVIVQLEQGPQNSGFWPALDVGGPNGLLAGFNGYLGDLPLPGGWVESRVRAGTNLRSNIDGTGSSHPVLTTGVADLRIRFPVLFGGTLRPATRLLAETLSRQRADLFINTVWQARFEADLAADFTPLGRDFELGMGVGLQSTLIFGLDGSSDPAHPIDQLARDTPSELFRPVLFSFLHWDLSADQVRRDRHHEIEALLRLRTGNGSSSGGQGDVGQGAAISFAGHTQRYFPLGWHEFWVRTHWSLQAGDVLYTDETPLSDELRGAFGDTWVRKSASLLTEARASLVRDLLKVSLFDSLVAYGQQTSRVPGQEREVAKAAFGVGVGLHSLIWTVLSVDLYFSVAYSTESRVSPGFALEIHEAYR